MVGVIKVTAGTNKGRCCFSTVDFCNYVLTRMQLAQGVETRFIGSGQSEVIIFVLLY